MPTTSRLRGWMPVEDAVALTKRSVRGFHALIRYKRIAEHEHYRFDPEGNLVVNVEAYLEWASENTSRGRSRQVMSNDRVKLHRHVTTARMADKTNADVNRRPRSESLADALTSAPAKDRAPKLVPLEVWAEQIFGEYAPHRNTLYNWRRMGWIVPAPIRVGGRYFVEPTAVYADSHGEMARRLGDSS